MILKAKETSNLNIQIGVKTGVKRAVLIRNAPLSLPLRQFCETKLSRESDDLMEAFERHSKILY
ncbi:MAG: hypothetical protein JSV93_02670 [Candidatus Omnitrophota bacterium]|nr:MAG: hypothetical protein JSV93_02670 [Candidatus Omnitrophota bacterium]